MAQSLPHDCLALFLRGWQRPYHVGNVTQDARLGRAHLLVFFEERLQLATLDPGMFQALLGRQALLRVDN